jgi:hypothetical protein
LKEGADLSQIAARHALGFNGSRGFAPLRLQRRRRRLRPFAFGSLTPAAFATSALAPATFAAPTLAPATVPAIAATPVPTTAIAAPSVGAPPVVVSCARLTARGVTRRRDDDNTPSKSRDLRFREIRDPQRALLPVKEALRVCDRLTPAAPEEFSGFRFLVIHGFFSVLAHVGNIRRSWWFKSLD